MNNEKNISVSLKIEPYRLMYFYTTKEAIKYMDETIARVLENTGNKLWYDDFVIVQDGKVISTGFFCPLCGWYLEDSQTPRNDNNERYCPNCVED